jgi:single-stranded DNA-specific DHH superfamily exonuclease
MEKPNFIIGNEKMFSEFISSLGKEKIAIVSHTDIDGIAAAKIANQSINANKLLFVNYSDLIGDFVGKIKKTGARKIIFTDLFFKNAEVIKNITKFAQILIIDHHSPDLNLNSDRTVHLNAQGFCSAYLCYYLFSKITNLAKWDWLVVAASIADVAYYKNQAFMAEVMSKYKDKFEISQDRQIRKNGEFWDFQWEITLALIANDPDYEKVFCSLKNDMIIPENLKEDIAKAQKEYDFWKNRFDEDKISIADGYFWELSPKYRLASFIINEISFEYPEKTFVFMSRTDGLCKFSTRRQDGQVDLNEEAKKWCGGFENADAGGHKKAAGGTFPIKYFSEFKKRLGIA